MEGIHGVTSVLVAASVRYWWVVVVSLKSVIVYLTGEEFCLVGWLVGWLVSCFTRFNDTFLPV